MEEKTWPQHGVLRDWIPRGRRDLLAASLGMSTASLHAYCAGQRSPSGDLCVLIERVTYGKVTRLMLRPDMFGDLTEAG